jgi:hypothetical protein
VNGATGSDETQGMRWAKGRVVGNTVVLEENLPEGLEVEVQVREPGDPDDVLTDEMEADLAVAMAEADRGEGTSSRSSLRVFLPSWG